MALIDGPHPKMPDFRAGFVIVAAGPKGIVSLERGTQLSWGERVFGGYNSFYYVDIGEKTYQSTVKCSSRDTGIDFDVTIRVSYRIRDAARAVKLGTSDPDALFAATVHRAVSDAASAFSVSDAVKAKRAIDAALLDLTVDPALTVVNASCDVRADAGAQIHLRRIAEENIAVQANAANARIERQRREEILSLFDDPNKLLAQSIVTNDPAFRDALNYKLRELDNDRQGQINLLKTLLEAKVIEPHDFHENYQPLIDAAMAVLRGPAGKTQPSPEGLAGPTINQSKG